MENEELIKILTLIEQQVITAEQGYQLMDSIKKAKEKKGPLQGRFYNDRHRTNSFFYRGKGPW